MAICLSLRGQLWTWLAAMGMACSYCNGCRLWTWLAAMAHFNSYELYEQVWTWLAATAFETVRGAISRKVKFLL